MCSLRNRSLHDDEDLAQNCTSAPLQHATPVMFPPTLVRSHGPIMFRTVSNVRVVRQTAAFTDEQLDCRACVSARLWPPFCRRHVETADD